MIQPQLKAYIEQEILPCYDHFDAAHQRDHAEEVIARSLALAEHYEVNENMVYAIAAYHDTGLDLRRGHRRYFPRRRHFGRLRHHLHDYPQIH